jgi:hypothetical protein
VDPNAKLIASDGAAYANFGYAIAMLGPTALVAAPYATVGSNANQGAVYVLTESTDGSWNQTDKLIASDGALNNYFGWNVSFDGQTAGISAIGATINNSLQGAAYFLERSGGDPHTVTPVIASGIGTTTPSGPQSVADGSTTSFTITPDSAYRVDSVGGTCAGTLANNVYTIVPATADCTVEIHFSAIVKTVTPSVSGGNGTISPNSPQTVNYGGTLSFTLNPDPGYVAGAIGGTCDGTLSGNTFTTAAVTGDCTVVATFRLADHMVTPSVSGGNGQMSPSSAQIVSDGATVAFTLLPDPGYTPDTIAGTCGGTLDHNTFTTAPVIGDCTVIVSYKVATYIVTPELTSGHGTISPGLPRIAHYGDVFTFTVSPDPFYVASVAGTCGGTLVGSTYTTAPISASCTVDASFTPAAQHTVSPSVASGSGAISPSSPQAVVDGGSLSFTLTPSTGFVIDSVRGTCGGSLQGATFTTNAVTADCSVQAIFVSASDFIFANGFE